MDSRFDPRQARFWSTRTPALSIFSGILFVVLGITAWAPGGNLTVAIVSTILCGTAAIAQFISAAVTVAERRRTGEVVPRAPLAQESDPNRRYETLR